MSQPEHATVERRHRLAVLRAQGYTEEWLAADGREKHVVARWVEHGWPHGPEALVLNGTQGLYDKLAQEMADMEAAGRQDREAYTKGLRQILDRIDRAIAEEVGQPLEPTVVEKIPADLQALLERLVRCNPDSEDVAVNGLIPVASEVVECFKRHQP